MSWKVHHSYQFQPVCDQMQPLHFKSSGIPYFYDLDHISFYSKLGLLISWIHSKENWKNIYHKIKLSLFLSFISVGNIVFKDFTTFHLFKSLCNFIILCYCTLLIVLQSFAHRWFRFFSMNSFFFHHEDVWFLCEG